MESFCVYIAGTWNKKKQQQQQKTQHTKKWRRFSLDKLEMPAGLFAVQL